jgi:hypothetical protein
MRERTRFYSCSQEGCKERAFYSYRSQKEYGDLPEKWTCLRHEHPDKVLSLENPINEIVLVSDGEYWCVGGRNGRGSGFAHGPGFRAWTGDFPAGTRLRVTAKIEGWQP